MSDEQLSEFGQWTSLEGRLEELRNRLVAWTLMQEAGSVWTEAAERFAASLWEAENPLDVPATALLEAFEGAINDHDDVRGQVLRAFPRAGGPGSASEQGDGE